MVLARKTAYMYVLEGNYFSRHKKIEEERRKADTAIDASADEVLVHWVSSASHLVTIKPVRYNNIMLR
mgnify:CR=1 FL=1|jgi:hypothetical protein